MKSFCLVLAAGGVCLACKAPAFAQNDSKSASALALEATYTAEVFTLAQGGLERGTRYMDNLDLTLSVDLERGIGLPRTQFFAYGLYNNGQSFSGEKAGDSFVISNIETGVQAARLFEAWVEHSFGAERGSLKVGLYDLNSEFDALEAADIFINSAHGIGVDFSQSGLNGPSIFPTTALGARLDIRLGESLRVRSAVLEGTPGDPDRPRRTTVTFDPGEGVLLVGELEARLAGARLLAGYWRYTARFADISASATAGADVLRRGNQGAYLRAEGWLWQEGSAGVPEHAAAEKSGEEEATPQGLQGFVRAGLAAGRFNHFNRFYAAGLVYTGALPGRDADQLGVAVAYGGVGSSARSASLDGDGRSTFTRAETALELTYKAQLTPWLTLQPDVQIIINPGNQRTLKTAYAFGLRSEISIDRLFRKNER